MRKNKYILGAAFVLSLILLIIPISSFAEANDFTVTVSGDVDCVYAKGVSYTLTASQDYTPSSQDAVYTYKWYKNGSLVSSLDTDTVTVSEVADSGSYVCSITVEDGGNTFFGTSDALDVSIRPAPIDLTGAAWNYSLPFVYCGDEQSVALTGLPEEVTASYLTFSGDYEPINTSVVRAGEYITVAELSYDDKNYTLTGIGFPELLNWKIGKATYDMSGITFSDKTVVENGYAQSIGINGTLPSGVTVSYYYNSRPFSGIKYAGEYTVKAVFSGDSVNYEPIADMTAKLTVTAVPTDTPEGISELVFRDSSGLKTVVVKSDTPLPQNTSVSAVNKTNDYKSYDFSSIAGENETAELAVMYDVTIRRAGFAVGTTGKFKVKLLIPEEYRGSGSLVAVYMNNGKPELISSIVEGDMLVFETDHFSLYGIVAVKTEQSPAFITYIFVAMLVVLIFVIAFRRKPSGKTDKSEEKESVSDISSFFKQKPSDVSTPSDGASAEPEPTPSEEDSAKLSAEEDPAELSAEEDTAEPSAEESTLSESLSDREEINTDANFGLPSNKDEYVGEDSSEDSDGIDGAFGNSSEEKLFGATAVIAVKEKPEAININSNDSVNIDGEEIFVRYRSSFSSRLIQSGDTVQGYYTVVKNYLLSFKGIKPRTSWNYETMRKGRAAVARLNVKGKSLIVNLALAPDSFPITKYHFLDLSSDKRYAELPMLLKVKSRRALAYTIELIDILMKSIGIEQGILPEVDYRAPYEPNRILAQRGLVKVIIPKGRTLDDLKNAAPENITDFLSVKAEQTLSVTREDADLLLSEEEAESRLAHSHDRLRTGRMCCVNIGEISESFAEGERVTLDTLKEKGLVERRCGRVKILADGVLNKPLRVEADRFSVSAVKMILLAGGSAKQID